MDQVDRETGFKRRRRYFGGKCIIIVNRYTRTLIGNRQIEAKQNDCLFRNRLSQDCLQSQIKSSLVNLGLKFIINVLRTLSEAD